MENEVKIICRADGDSKTGLGHLYRMFAIIEFYKEQYDILFLTRETSVAEVIPETYTSRLIPKHISTSQEPEWLFQHFDPSLHLLITDGYAFDSHYQKAIKNRGYKLVSIVDFCSEHVYADVVINHSLSCSTDDFTAEAYTSFALGTPYAILRPSFMLEAEKKREITVLDNAFICFGGADPQNLSLKAAKALAEIPSIQRINVVLGGAYKDEEIYSLAEQDIRIRLFKNMDEQSLCALMRNCQVAIAPASTIMYELCAVKMLVLGGYYVDNQKMIYEGLVKKGLILGGGNFSNYEVADFIKGMERLLAENRASYYMENQAKSFDGKAKVRYLNLLSQLLA